MKDVLCKVRANATPFVLSSLTGKLVSGEKYQQSFVSTGMVVSTDQERAGRNFLG